jgi:hypothetical protein
MSGTLRELLAEHPEWADLPVAVGDSVGELYYIDGNGMVYVSEDEGKPVLIFDTN